MELFKPLCGEKYYNSIFASGFAAAERHAKHSSPDPLFLNVPGKVTVDEYSVELDADDDEVDGVELDDIIPIEIEIPGDVDSSPQRPIGDSGDRLIDSQRPNGGSSSGLVSPGNLDQIPNQVSDSNPIPIEPEITEAQRKIIEKMEIQRAKMQKVRDAKAKNRVNVTTTVIDTALNNI